MTDTQRVILLMVILLLIAILFGTAGWAKWRRRRGRPVAELLHTDTDSGHPTTVVRGLHDQWSVTLMLAVCAGMFAAFAVFVWDCSCRKPHPYRSGRMFVFVQDASKPIAASDPKLGYVV